MRTLAPPPTSRQAPADARALPWIVAGTCLALFAVMTVASVHGGALDALDWHVWRTRPERHWPALKPCARALTYLGLRAPTAAIALFYAWRLSRRVRSWRPLVVLVGSL